jgi:hypothetical protein
MEQTLLGKILFSIAPIFGATGFYPVNKCKSKNAQCEDWLGEITACDFPKKEMEGVDRKKIA